MSEIVFPSTKAGNEVDRAVTAALSTIPGQVTQLDTRVTALEDDVDDLQTLPAQVTQIGLKIGDLAIKRNFAFSDNDEVNQYIKEVYIASPPSDFTQTSVTFYFIRLASWNNKYYNNVRIGAESSSDKYVNLTTYYDTKQEAIDGLQNYKGILKFDNNYIYCDFSGLNISESYYKSYSCTYYDVTDIDKSPVIRDYLTNNRASDLASNLDIKINNAVTRIGNVETDLASISDEVENVGKKIIKIVGFRSSDDGSGVTEKGQIYYNTRLHRLRQVTNDALTRFVTMPFEEDSLYLWENTLSKYDGEKLIPLSDGWAFSDFPEINKYIKEVYLESTPVNFTPTSIQIMIAVQSGSKFYNAIRIGESKDTTYYVNLLKGNYSTEEEAIAAICDKPQIYYVEGKGAALIDFTSIKSKMNRAYSHITFYDVTDITLSPIIKNFYDSINSHSIIAERAFENVNAINGSYAHQCPDQFYDLDNVFIFRDGILLSKSKYDLNKLGKVIYKDGVDGDTAFAYNKKITTYPQYKNNLSVSTPQPPVTEGSANDMTSFVDDPSGSDNKVLMISCEEIAEGAKVVRDQFSLGKYPVTEFEDSVKMWLPNDMRTALLSYSSSITWFSIGGAWGVFGSPKGQTNKMYSGSGNSFDIVKPTADSTELYFNIRCRRRHCNTSTGIEEYDVLTEEMSQFPIKSGEWITIKRHWKVGNPGICNYEITDSDGKHVWNVNAYNSVVDPENEASRYGSKYLGSNPYNIFSPFIAKIYTSTGLVQHCIDTIGKCYLYFKDYEFIYGENVNAIE